MAFLHINAFDYIERWMKGCGSLTKESNSLTAIAAKHLTPHKHTSANNPDIWSNVIIGLIWKPQAQGR